MLLVINDSHLFLVVDLIEFAVWLPVEAASSVEVLVGCACVASTCCSSEHSTIQVITVHSQHPMHAARSTRHATGILTLEVHL